MYIAENEIQHKDSPDKPVVVIPTGAEVDPDDLGGESSDNFRLMVTTGSVREVSVEEKQYLDAKQKFVGDEDKFEGISQNLQDGNTVDNTIPGDAGSGEAAEI